MLLCIISFVADLNLHARFLVSSLLILLRNYSTGEYKVLTIQHVFRVLSAALLLPLSSFFTSKKHGDIHLNH